MAIAIAILFAELGFTNISRASSAIIELSVGLALSYGLFDLLTWKRWPVLELFLWSYAEQARLYGFKKDPENRGGIGVRLDDLMLQARPSPESWHEIRSLAHGLPPILRESVFAMADIVVTGEFESARFEAAIADLEDPAERRYWSVRLTMTHSFAAYLADTAYVDPLIEAADGIVSRPRMIARHLRFPGLLLGAGFLLALFVAIVLNN